MAACPSTYPLANPWTQICETSAQVYHAEQKTTLLFLNHLDESTAAGAVAGAV